MASNAGWLYIFKPTLFQRTSDPVMCSRINECSKGYKLSAQELEHQTDKILMGLGGFHDTESVSTVRGNFSDFLTAFIWLFRARWTAVMYFDLIYCFSIVENTPSPPAQVNPSCWMLLTLRNRCWRLECRRLQINLTVRITCDISTVGPPLNLFLQIPSLVPRSRPAFRRFQYGKEGLE